MVQKSQKKQTKLSQLKIQKFNNAKFIRGPHKIPLKRQKNNQFFRTFSIKAGMRSVASESLLEENVLIWGESNPEITHICEQPIRIYEPIGYQPYITLDVSFTYKDGREIFYEVKPESKLQPRSDGRMAPKNWDIIDAWFNNNGFFCDFITEKKIGDLKHLANWRRIISFARQSYEYPEPLLEADLINLCKQYRSISFNDIIKNFIQPEDIVLSCVTKLIHQGILKANLDEINLSKNTIVWSAEHA